MHIYIYKVRNGEFQIRSGSNTLGLYPHDDPVLFTVSSPSAAQAAVSRLEAEWADDAPTVRMAPVDDDGPGGAAG